MHIPGYPVHIKTFALDGRLPEQLFTLRYHVQLIARRMIPHEQGFELFAPLPPLRQGGRARKYAVLDTGKAILLQLPA